MTPTYLAGHNAVNFSLPTSPRCKVIYRRDKVTYATPPMRTPGSRDSLQVALLGQGIGISQVVRVESVRS